MLNNPPVPTNTPLFSRRSRRRAETGQTRLPDWVWGAGLGLIVLVFIGGYFLVSERIGGGGGSACDEPLAPLGNSAVNSEAFLQEEAGLTRVIQRLEQGDREGAEATFYGPVHNFTHDVDPTIRAEDEELAKEICREVREVEDELSARASNTDILESLLRLRELLRDAAVELGYPRPGDTAGRS